MQAMLPRRFSSTTLFGDGHKSQLGQPVVRHVSVCTRRTPRSPARAQYSVASRPSRWAFRRQGDTNSEEISRCVAVHAASGGAALQQTESKNNRSAIFSVLMVLVLGVLNRVLHKMATVPMGKHLFFLAQIQTFGYVLFYGAILTQRRRAGIVTNKMLAVTDKRKFVAIGFLEAAAQLISMLCVSKLPGVVIPLLQQTILLWQVALGYIFQRQRFQTAQLIGIALVVIGVAKAAWPSGQGTSILGKTNPAFAALFSSAFLLLAAVALIKDTVFNDAKKKLDGQSLDLFVVNTNGSLAQAAFVLLLLPILSSLQGIPFSDLPATFAEGFKALRGVLPGTTGAPAVPLTYVLTNLTLNVAVLNLLRTAGPVVTTLSLSALVPLTIWAFTWPWPLIGAPASLSTGFILGTVILLAGLVTYNWTALRGS